MDPSPSNSSGIERAKASPSFAAGSSQEVTTDEQYLRGMDVAVYKAAKEGETDALYAQREGLPEILTPTKNTVLHIYIACAGRTKTLSSGNSANVTTVESILEMCPALLSQANDAGETALHVAARHGHSDIVEHLISAAKAGDPEKACWSVLMRTPNSHKDTAFHEAVRFNHFDVVHTLTREDRDFPYSANAAGETPLYMAVERGYHNLVSKILETCTRPSCGGPDGRTALHAAVIHNDEEMTRKLLCHFPKERALTKEVDEQGWTPLHYAAFFGHSTLVIKLLDSDRSAAYIRDKNDKMTALHIAASRGHLDVMKELISNCPDCCELVDKRLRNVLHYAIEKHNFQIQDFIRKDPWLSSILLNGKDEDQNTPLHQFVSSAHEIRALWFTSRLIVNSCSDFIWDARVDKMTFNKENLNAFDIIQANRTSLTIVEKDIKMQFEKNRARSGHRLISSFEDTEFKEDKDAGCAKGKDVGGAKGKDARGAKGSADVMKELKQAHLVVATLIATVTFTAGMTMPGGYQSQKGHDQGLAVLIRFAGFLVFVLANTAAMTLSCLAVLLHLYVILTAGPEAISHQFAWVLKLTMCALLAMLAAFISGTYAVLDHSSFSALNCAISLILFITITNAFFFRRSRSRPGYELRVHEWFAG